jgi:hypothetical protein
MRPTTAEVLDVANHRTVLPKEQAEHAEFAMNIWMNYHGLVMVNTMINHSIFDIYIDIYVIYLGYEYLDISKWLNEMAKYTI